MSDTVLDTKNLQVEFASGSRGKVVAVNGIGFQLQRGQILGIVGESGSGKSVTSLAIMRLIPTPGKISAGEILFHPGKQKKGLPEGTFFNLLSLNPQQMEACRGGEIAMIFQEPMSSLNPVYTIGFQIIEAIILHQDVTPEQAKNQALALLQEVKLLPSDEELEEKFLDKLQEKGGRLPGSLTSSIKDYIKQQKESLLKRYPHELSGGQLQRVMIAIAICSNPTILIADEPTTALDVTVQAEILHLLRDLCKTNRNMSMIFISHDLGVINEIADVVAVMYEGKIVETGDKEQILYYPQHPYTKGLLACRPRLNLQLEKLPTVADFMTVQRDERGKVLEILSKRPPEFIPVDSQQEFQRLFQLKETKESLLQIEDLSVEFPVRNALGRTKEYFKAVDAVSLTVKPGETIGLVGESGCGKSTLARTILRLIPAARGQIYFQGENLTALPMGSQKLRQIRRNMQIVFQNPYNSLNPRLTIGQAIMEPLIIYKTGGNSVQRSAKVRDLLRRVGLDADWFNRYPHQLSGGQRQRVCIARALALNPQFIICDESVSALDVSVQAEILNLLKQLRQDFGLTYIFISHDLSVVRFMSDRIVVMNQGKIEEMGGAAQIINHPEKDYTKKLIASIPKFPQEDLL